MLNVRTFYQLSAWPFKAVNFLLLTLKLWLRPEDEATAHILQLVFTSIYRNEKKFIPRLTTQPDAISGLAWEEAFSINIGAGFYIAISNNGADSSVILAIDATGSGFVSETAVLSIVGTISTTMSIFRRWIEAKVSEVI